MTYGGAAPIQIISPWAQHGKVDSHYYTQNRTSLTAGLATQPPCGPDVPAAQNPAAAPAPTGAVPADQQAVAAKWNTWKSQQTSTSKADSANPAQMNHFSRYEAHNWAVPYPGDDKIFAPADVPGAVIPSAENDG